MNRFIHIDLRPLRVSPPFRRLYLAGYFSALGTQATMVAMAYQLRELTNSTFAVGALGLVEVVPLIIFGFYGGVIADRLDRQRITVWTEIATAGCAAVLALNSFVSRPATWIVFVIAAVLTIAQSLQTPSLGAMSQILVPHDLQRAASQLGSLRTNTMSLVGPSIGGLMATTIGPGWAYVLNLATFVFSLTLLLRIGSSKPTPGEATSPLAMMREGASYVRTRPDIVGSYIVDIVAMALAYPVVMLPFVATRYHEKWALSVLYVALPLGALLAQLISRWTHRVFRYGRAIIFSSLAWGVGITIFGLATPLWIVVGGLVVAGWGDSYSASFRQTYWNESIMPDMRGRMAGVELVSYAVGPMAGQFRSGVMASWLGLRASLAWGGVASTVVNGLGPVALKSLWRFDARTDPHVAAVQRARAVDEGSVS